MVDKVVVPLGATESDVSVTSDGGSGGGLSSLPREELLAVTTEQNDKLKELLTHFRLLQDENTSLRASLKLPAQLQPNRNEIPELLCKSAQLVNNVETRSRNETRDRGITLAPTDTLISLKAENERLHKLLDRGASHAAADTVEVNMLKERNSMLEKKTRDLRSRLQDAEARVRVAEALTREQNNSETSKHTRQQLATVAASLASASPPSSPLTDSAPGSPSKKKSLNLEGTLLKQGGGWGPFKAHFKERFFELRGAQGTLYYSSKKGGDQVGEISLEQVTCAMAEIKPFSFCVFGPKLSRTYVLAAASLQERAMWMSAITRASEHYTKFLRGELDEVSPPQSFLNSVVDGVGDARCVYYRDEQDAAAPKAPALEDFDLLVVVGVGSFGKVLKVRHKQDGRTYAMKVLQKDMIVKHRMVPHTKAEKCILEISSHPFVVKMHYAFQTRRQLVFILDFLTGGELFFHLVNEQRFSEERAKFYAVEIALALEHLHSKNIIYRDLKPENLVLDCDGHVCLTDFGLAKTEVTDVTHTFCGTPQYMAPELIMKQGHGRAADWWSLGVFLFEMIVGKAPFPNNGNVKELYEAIVTKPPPFPTWMSREARECLGHMLSKDPATRTQSIDSLMKMKFFSNLDAKAIEAKKVPVPFTPQHKGDDTRYVDAEFKREKLDLGRDPTHSKEGATIIFDDFTFIRENAPKLHPGKA